MKNIMQEITPVLPDDLFIVLHHTQVNFDFPTHYHADYEINFVKNAKGKRIVGDSIADFVHTDLVMLGPMLYHCWQGTTLPESRVVTIQFAHDLFNMNILDKKLFVPIKEMLENSKRGIEFSTETQQKMESRIMGLHDKHGVEATLAFFSILYDLSLSMGQRYLASQSYNALYDETKSKRIQKVLEYVDKHLHEKILIKNVAELVNMSETSFSHFFKKRTNCSFTDYLMDLRLGAASKLLFETDITISEICFLSGFNSISHFNRIFKRKKGCTPGEYREQQRLII